MSALILYTTITVGSLLMLLILSRGPFFVPTQRRHVPRIIEMLRLKPGERVVDLGSGDGRLLLALGETGAEAHGFEHNPILVWRSRRRIKQAGLEKRVVVFRNNFWNCNIGNYDAVVIYGIPYIMGRLEEKLQKELKPGARVVSYSFPFPHWQPSEREKRIFLYKRSS